MILRTRSDFRWLIIVAYPPDYFFIDYKFRKVNQNPLSIGNLIRVCQMEHLVIKKFRYLPGYNSQINRWK